MKVIEYMKNNAKNIISTKADTKIREAMSLLIDNKISCLPVVNDKIELLGIISDKDIFLAAYKNSDNFTNDSVRDHMTTDLIVGLAEDDFDYIAGLMNKNRIRHIPIVKNKQLVGLLSLGDIVKSHLTSMKIENRYLKMYIEDSYPG